MIHICIVSELGSVVEIYASNDTSNNVTVSILDLDDELIAPPDINDKYQAVIENMECIYKR